MAAPPSLIRSRALADICDQHNLSDPYRALHPDRRDFTFRPSNRRNNRSRLDFFIISDTLINMISICDISPEILCSLFDHHYVTLAFNSKKFKLTKKLTMPFCLIRGSWRLPLLQRWTAIYNMQISTTTRGSTLIKAR